MANEHEDEPLLFPDPPKKPTHKNGKRLPKEHDQDAGGLTMNADEWEAIEEAWDELDAEARAEKAKKAATA